MNKQYAICVMNEGYEASLELRKLYEVVKDSKAEKLGQLRVVDESGEDYLYGRERFVALKLPPTVKKKIAVVL